ncbi:MAG: hypothetical protein CVT94_09395 [Bacteroidetes bacterium HGW-Bacteroidetes-11]|jgi:type I restriction enzyme S subunit|nr:MAG: hypothetical protein CVT94_09395 [Bacteroidetes bacterium HGW-Bacteroidetes-11]
MENTLDIAIEELKLNRSNWKLVKFGDIAIQQKQSVDRDYTELTKYVKGEHMGSEDLHLREWGELTDEYLGPAFIRKFEAGDILYGSRRTYLRKVVIAPFEGITSNTTFVIKANEKKIDKRLLPFIMLSEGFAINSIKNSKGSVNPYINWKDISNYEFPLPPKDQQAQLAELLWAMDEVIEKEMEVLEILKSSSQIFFENAVENIDGKLIPLSRILIPKNSKSHVPHERKKYIGLEHIESGNLECISFSDTSEVLAQCNIIEPRDLCYSKLRPYLDKAFIANFEAISTTELLIYDTHKASKEYVLFHLHSRPFLHFVTGKAFGTKMPRVSHKIIGEFEIKVPEDESIIISKMSLFVSSQKLIKSKIASSKALQKSLINQIF